MKDLWKFQDDIPITAGVAAVQNLESLHTFVLRGGQKNTHQRREDSSASLAHNSVFIDPNSFKFGTETCCMVVIHNPYQNF